jgi:ribosomal protein L44E
VEGNKVKGGRQQGESKKHKAESTIRLNLRYRCNLCKVKGESKKQKARAALI